MSDTGGGDSTGGSVGELVQGGGGAFFILVRAIGQVGRLGDEKGSGDWSLESVSVRRRGQVGSEAARTRPPTQRVSGLSLVNPTHLHPEPALTSPHRYLYLTSSHRYLYLTSLTGINLTSSHRYESHRYLYLTSSHRYQSHQLSLVSISPALTGISISPTLTSSHWYESLWISPALTGMNLSLSHQLSPV
ncbi:hypothetical protein PSTG_09107 [Puccinia striiformis f. sp. tritici PST-78]|uniref:Uncharacterized protein n=1 Tax=Puccinia striiformis f. sp. tritici PST-78 TaxID=1165861 RepID=A0A0L0VEE5_9BASI|nr:hypothetical protein PSTG_09107 [Puccinia striiformis f. sp. tritici PST-78]